MLQERLWKLLTVFRDIEQELAYNVNVNEVIDTFETFRPVERHVELWNKATI